MNARTDKPLGLVEGMPLGDYLAIDAMSASGLKQLARSPWHYKNQVKTEQTPAMRAGNLAHCAILEPDKLADRYVAKPNGLDFRTKEGKAWRDALPVGIDVIDADQRAIASAQQLAVLGVPELAALLRTGRGEVSIFWIDEATGIYCKARPDWMPPADGGRITPLDLKTCADESPGGFGRAAARLRYDLQAAHYTAGIESVTGLTVAAFVFGAVSNKPPILAVPYVLTDEIREQARDERCELMDRLAWCQRENEWPAYGSGFQLLDFPAYAKHGGEVEIEWSEA